MKTTFVAIACSLFSLSTLSANHCGISNQCKVNRHASQAVQCPQEAPETDRCPTLHECCHKADKWCGVTYALYGNWLFLQPNGSNLYYAAEANALDPDITIPAASPNWKIHEISPNYHSGFEVGTNFLFRNTGINIDVNWERLHGHDGTSVNTSKVSGDMVGPFFDIGPNSFAYVNARGKLRSHFDQVNLMFGKKMCFFNRLFMNFGAGVGFGRIKQSLQSTYSNNVLAIARSVKTSSEFIGAGPEITIDYDYRMFDHVFFTGTTYLSLFMGQMKNHTTFKSWTPELAALGIAQPNVQSTHVPNRAQLVPGLQQKFGFSYIAAWKCLEMTLEIGYQCQIYWDAVQSVDMTAPQVLPAGAAFTPDVGVFAVGFERTLSNYILTGPYASLKFAF